MQIRDDLVGVVWVHTSRGDVRLRAGDVVPAGASVGCELLTPDIPAPAATRGRPRTRKAKA